MRCSEIKWKVLDGQYTSMNTLSCAFNSKLLPFYLELVPDPTGSLASVP